MNKYFLVLLLAVFVLLAFAALRIETQNLKQTGEDAAVSDTVKQNLEGNKYKAPDMPVDFMLPQGYSYEAKNNLVILRLNNTDESILIDRIATEMTDVDNYVADLVSKNKINVLEKKALKLNGLDWQMIEYVHLKDRKRVYMSVSDGWAYTVEGTSSKVNKDLDAVAESLKIKK